MNNSGFESKRSFHDELISIELDMFRATIKICNDHNLIYFLVGGSCLGAVRDHGVIPWDDDIDIAMPRKDWKKFIVYAQKELEYPLSVQSWQTEPDFRLDFAKIRNCNTTFVGKEAKHLHINHGVFIDVFPIDGYPNSSICRKCLSLIKKVFRLYLFREIWEAVSPKEKFALNIMRFLYKNNAAKAQARLQKIYEIFPYDRANIVVLHGGSWGEKEIHDKKVYGNGQLVLFENIEARVPADFDSYLTKMYGNYMELPPESERVTHHNTVVCDLEKPFTEYLDEDADGNNIWRIKEVL